MPFTRPHLFLTRTIYILWLWRLTDASGSRATGSNEFLRCCETSDWAKYFAKDVSVLPGVAKEGQPLAEDHSIAIIMMLPSDSQSYI